MRSFVFSPLLFAALSTLVGLAQAAPRSSPRTSDTATCDVWTCPKKTPDCEYALYGEWSHSRALTCRYLCFKICWSTQTNLCRYQDVKTNKTGIHCFYDVFIQPDVFLVSPILMTKFNSNTDSLPKMKPVPNNVLSTPTYAPHTRNILAVNL
jgi:hypothetical protein